MNSEPLVDVALVTYNQEKYIAQAIESVLVQKTDFEYRLIIGDDFSTDNTQAIIKSYADAWPRRIETLLQPEHVGILHPDRVGIKILKLCTAKYLAMLDGDDYWTSPYKLQKQVDFLGSHPDYSISFHPVEWFYESSDKTTLNGPGHSSVWPENPKETSSIEDILESVYIQTSSVVFRNHLFGNYPEWMCELPFGDWPLFILHAHHGKIGCLSEVMSAYRRHAESVWFVVEDEKRLQAVIKMYEHLNAHFEYQYADIIRPILADQCFELAVLYDQRGDPKLALEAIKKSLAAQLASRRRPSANSLKMLARLSVPSIYSLSKRLMKA